MTDLLVTTKPGDKYRSLRNPKVYEALRAKGYSKAQAARISNAQARRRKRKADYPDQSQFAGHTMEDWDHDRPHKKPPRADVEAARQQFARALGVETVAQNPRHKAYTLDTLEAFVSSPAYDPAIAQAIADRVPELPRYKGEQIAPGITRIRGNLCNVHGKYGPCDKALSGKPKGGKGKAPKGAKPKQTDQEKQQARDAKKLEREQQHAAEQAKNLTSAGDATDLGDHLSNLDQFASGKNIRPEDVDFLATQGLMERGADGTPRLTANGRTLLSAAKRGDMQAARDAQSRGRDQAGKPAAAAADRGRNLTKVGDATDLGDHLANLDKASQGKPLRPADVDELSKRGLMERGTDGTPRLTASGRATLHAAERGDAQAANDAISRARDTVAKRGEAQTKREQAQKLRAQRLAKQGKGKGGGKQANSSSETAQSDRAAKREQTASDTAQQVGLSAGSVTNLRNAAEGQALNDDGTSHALESLGLVQNGETTDQGRRALSALERGDVRGYQAALQDARARLAREAQRGAGGVPRATGTHRNAATAARAEDRANGTRRRKKALNPRGKSFEVFKDARGAWRWVAFSSTAYRDRDGEIVSTKALADDCDLADRLGHYGPLRWWHVPGLDLGDCDFNAMHGRVLIESGTFRSEQIAQKVARAAAGLEISLGFLHPPTQPDASGIFHQIRRFERSLTPRGKASNLFTSFSVKESPAMDETKKAALKALGFNDADITDLESRAQATQKSADEQGVAYKAADPEEITIGGQTYVLKAVPMVEPETTEAELPGETDQEVEYEADDSDGLSLSPEDLQACEEACYRGCMRACQEAMTPLMGLLDIEKKMQGHVQSMVAPLQQAQATKDASDAEQREAIATLQTTLKDTQAKLTELTGDQPTVPYRASAAHDNVLSDAALLGAVKSQIPAGGDWDDIITGLGLRPQSQP